jgi:hypothetical protein
VSPLGIAVSVVIDLAIILDLMRRTILAWWVAVLLSLSRSAFGGVVLSLVTAGGQGRVLPELEFCGFIMCGVGFFVMLLLIYSRACGSYWIRFEGERRQPALHPRARTSCRRCGDPCPEIDNRWTRDGRCSKKCAEKS